MLIHIKRFIVKSYADLLKESYENILGDIVLLVMIVSCMIAAHSFIGYKTITLFDITYRLSILVFYLLGFVFVLTTSSLFRDLRGFLNLATRSIIRRFPRMQGNFTPGKAILRDLVQMLILMLVFYPVSQVAVSISYNGFISYMISMLFLLLTMMFAYDITLNLLKIASEQIQAITRTFFTSGAVNYSPESDAD